MKCTPGGGYLCRDEDTPSPTLPRMRERELTSVVANS